MRSILSLAFIFALIWSLMTVGTNSRQNFRNSNFQNSTGKVLTTINDQESEVSNSSSSSFISSPPSFLSDTQSFSSSSSPSLLSSSLPSSTASILPEIQKMIQAEKIASRGLMEPQAQAGSNMEKEEKEEEKKKEEKEIVVDDDQMNESVQEDKRERRRKRNVTKWKHNENEAVGKERGRKEMGNEEERRESEIDVQEGKRKQEKKENKLNGTKRDKSSRTRLSLSGIKKTSSSYLSMSSSFSSSHSISPPTSTSGFSSSSPPGIEGKQIEREKEEKEEIEKEGKSKNQGSGLRVKLKALSFSFHSYSLLSHSSATYPSTSLLSPSSSEKEEKRLREEEIREEKKKKKSFPSANNIAKSIHEGNQKANIMNLKAERKRIKREEKKEEKEEKEEREGKEGKKDEEEEKEKKVEKSTQGRFEECSKQESGNISQSSQNSHLSYLSRLQSSQTFPEIVRKFSNFEGISSKNYDFLFWICSFLIINLIYALIVILKLLPPKKMDKKLLSLYETIFLPFQVNLKEFETLINGAKIIELSPNDNYALEHVTKINEKVSILLAGKLKVTCDDIHLHDILPNQFIDSPEFNYVTIFGAKIEPDLKIQLNQDQEDRDEEDEDNDESRDQDVKSTQKLLLKTNDIELKPLKEEDEDEDGDRDGDNRRKSSSIINRTNVRIEIRKYSSNSSGNNENTTLLDNKDYRNRLCESSLSNPIGRSLSAVQDFEDEELDADQFLSQVTISNNNQDSELDNNCVILTWNRDNLINNIFAKSKRLDRLFNGLIGKDITNKLQQIAINQKDNQDRVQAILDAAAVTSAQNLSGDQMSRRSSIMAIRSMPGSRRESGSSYRSRGSICISERRNSSLSQRRGSSIHGDLHWWKNQQTGNARRESLTPSPTPGAPLSMTIPSGSGNISPGNQKIPQNRSCSIDIGHNIDPMLSAGNQTYQKHDINNTSKNFTDDSNNFITVGDTNRTAGDRNRTASNFSASPGEGNTSSAGNTGEGNAFSGTPGSVQGSMIPSLILPAGQNLINMSDIYNLQQFPSTSFAALNLVTSSNQPAPSFLSSAPSSPQPFYFVTTNDPQTNLPTIKVISASIHSSNWPFQEQVVTQVVGVRNTQHEGSSGPGAPAQMAGTSMAGNSAHVAPRVATNVLTLPDRFIDDESDIEQFDDDNDEDDDDQTPCLDRGRTIRSNLML